MGDVRPTTTFWEGPMASTKSMKTILGACSSAMRKAPEQVLDRHRSQQNLYPALISTYHGFAEQNRDEGSTFSKLARSLELTRKILIAALGPRNTPCSTSALPPPPQACSPIHLNSSVIAYEGGNCPCARHIFLSIMENRFRW